MELRYEITEKDVIAFNIYHLKNSKTGRNSLIWQRVALPFIFLLFAYFLTLFTELPAAELYGTFVIAAIIWVLFYPKYFYWHVSRQVRKMLSEGKSEGFVGTHVLKMTVKGLTDETEVSESKITWKAIQRFVEDADYFYLYNSAVSALIIPKREVDPSAVREFVKKWIS